MSTDPGLDVDHDEIEAAPTIGFAPPAQPAVIPERRRGERRRGLGGVRTSLFNGAVSLRERRLAARLDHEILPIGAVLHGCRIGGSPERIDHVVVAPGGVWTVVAEHARGRVACRLGADGQWVVSVDDTDRCDRVAHASAAAERMRSVLARIGLDWVDVTPVLCFTNARLRTGGEGPVHGVRLETSRTLVREVVRPGPLLQRDARRVAEIVLGGVDVDGGPDRRR